MRQLFLSISLVTLPLALSCHRETNAPTPKVDESYSANDGTSDEIEPEVRETQNDVPVEAYRLPESTEVETEASSIAEEALPPIGLTPRTAVIEPAPAEPAPAEPAPAEPAPAEPAPAEPAPAEPAPARTSNHCTVTGEVFNASRTKISGWYQQMIDGRIIIRKEDNNADQIWDSEITFTYNDSGFLVSETVERGQMVATSTYLQYDSRNVLQTLDYKTNFSQPRSYVLQYHDHRVAKVVGRSSYGEYRYRTDRNQNIVEISYYRAADHLLTKREVISYPLDDHTTFKFKETFQTAADGLMFLAMTEEQPELYRLRSGYIAAEKVVIAYRKSGTIRSRKTVSLQSSQSGKMLLRTEVDLDGDNQFNQIFFEEITESCRQI